jgi:hypothetical protein
MLIITRTIFLLVSLIFFASYAQAQMCGTKFSQFIISNSANKIISNTTIEILAIAPKEAANELWLKYGDHKDSGGYGYFKIRDKSFKEVIRKSDPLKTNRDDCGNPLKQHANLTEVKSREDQFKNRNPSKDNFGFCTIETELTKYILKISAPGYITSYYIGTFLGGCYSQVYFVLRKK